MFYMEAVMKIIHTADWHLGKILNGKQLLEDQAYILDMFVEKNERRRTRYHCDSWRFI